MVTVILNDSNVQTDRQTVSLMVPVSWLGLRPSGAVLHSSDESGKLWQ